MARLCFTEIVNGQSRTRCREFENRVTAEEVRDNLEKTFGETRTPEGRALVDTAAAAITEGHAARGFDERMRKDTVKSLNDTCATASDPAACQAAANIASIQSLEMLTRINDSLVTANNLKATQLAMEKARIEAEGRDRDLQEDLLLRSMNRQTQKPLELQINLRDQ